MKYINIEYIHDIVCSWCPINYQYLKESLNDLKSSVVAEIKFLPYELSPHMGDKGERIDLFLKRAYGFTDERHDKYRENLLKTAKKAGVDIDFSKRTHYFNTSKAHKLMHWSESKGLQIEMNEMLIKQYFTNGMNVSDDESLLDMVEQMGIDKNEIRDVISNPTIPDSLKNKYDRAKLVVTSGVPTLIFNKKYVVPGVKSAEFYREIILEKSFEKSNEEQASDSLVFL